MSRYILSGAADADLGALFDYGLTTYGRPRAVRYLESLLSTLDLLAQFPRMARERTEASEPVRVHHHGRHYIIYRVREDHILIVRAVRDEADLDALLRGFA